jgi:hypothetical protein
MKELGIFESEKKKSSVDQSNAPVNVITFIEFDFC